MVESDPFDERIDISDLLFLLRDREDVLLDPARLSLLDRRHENGISARPSEVTVSFRLA